MAAYDPHKSRNHYAANRDARLEQMRARYEANRPTDVKKRGPKKTKEEKNAVRNARRRAQRAPQIAAREEARRELDTPEHREQKRKAKRLADRAYLRANPERRRAKNRIKNRRRRAKLHGATGRHTAADIKRIYNDQRGLCAYHRHCHSPLLSNYHVDHIVPLARGGSNAPNNLQLCCPDCNQTKCAKDPIDFARSLGALL